MVECQIVLHAATVLDPQGPVIRTATARLDLSLPHLPREGDVLYFPYEWDESGDATLHLTPAVQTVKTILRKEQAQWHAEYIIEMKSPAIPVEPDAFEKGVGRWKQAGFQVEEKTVDNG